MLRVHPACLSVTTSPAVIGHGEDEVLGPNEAVLCGRLKNS